VMVVMVVVVVVVVFIIEGMLVSISICICP
jgi:hypothetical protein